MGDAESSSCDQMQRRMSDFKDSIETNRNKASSFLNSTEKPDLHQHFVAVVPILN